MESEIIAYGDKYALVIERDLLEQSHMQIGSRVNLSTDGESILVTPKEREVGPEEIKAPLVKINERYQPALKRLAE